MDIEIDHRDEEAEETDSACDPASSIQTLTTSLKSTVYQYREQGGRTFHSFRDGSYRFPNDETELDRMDLQHHMFRIMKDDQLFLAPITSNPQDVLDVGTGTGIWAIEFADMHPSAIVIGTDLSPCQPSYVPPNVKFEIDDAADDWLFRQKFDFVHVRYLQATVEEKRLFRQAYNALKPGGWFEIHEAALPLYSHDGTLNGTALKAWSDELLELGRQVGYHFDNPIKYPKWLEDTGFINIKNDSFILPSNTWPKDPKLKKLGRWQQLNLLEGIEGWGIKLFMDLKGDSREEYLELVERVQRDVCDRSIHSYINSIVVYGQKPMS